MNRITAGLAIIFLGSALQGIGRADETPGVRATIQSVKDRKPAPVSTCRCLRQGRPCFEVSWQSRPAQFLGNRMWWLQN